MKIIRRMIKPRDKLKTIAFPTGGNFSNIAELSSKAQFPFPTFKQIQFLSIFL